MEELWKPIKGYEGLYEVSNLGRVKSLVGWNGKEYVQRDKILKISRVEGQYGKVSLHKNRKSHTAEVHRLVAENWVDNPNNYPQVMHLDEDKHNNRADNLKWGTAKENANFPNHKRKLSESMSKRKGKLNSFYGKKHSEATRKKLSESKKGNANGGKPVYCEGVYYKSIKECALNYNINPHTMRSWLRGANQMPREWIEKELRYDK